MLHSGSWEKRPRCSEWVRVHLWVFNEQQQLKGNETESSVRTSEAGSTFLLSPAQLYFYGIACETPDSRTKTAFDRKNRPLRVSHRQHIYWFALFMLPVFHCLFQPYNTSSFMRHLLNQTSDCPIKKKKKKHTVQTKL